MTRALTAGFLLLAGSSCIIFQRRINIDEIKTGATQRITTPVRAHLLDGTTVVFRNGASVTLQSVVGTGWRYDLTLRDSLLVQELPLDSILGMEAYRQSISGTSAVYSLGATAVTVLGAVAIACAIDPKCFGSCPTVYSDSSGVALLEPRTFLLASQGYYIEWIRREWLVSGRDSTAFRPSRTSLVEAIRRWSTVQDSMEQRFYATRVPVR